MITHLSMLACFFAPVVGLAAPIIVWQIKKNELPELDVHGKNAANFAISMAIYSAISTVLILAFVGILLLLVLHLLCLVLPIIRGLQARDGVAKPYPLAIKFLT
jgi:uncharacterized protein